ncbi:MAG: FtsB family cell division protein [Anaerolineae bacterium]
MALLPSGPMALVLILAALFLVFNFGSEALSIRQEQQRLLALQAEVAALEQQRDQLQRRWDEALRPEHLEQIARDQMMMAYPGDQVWVPYKSAAEGPEKQPALPRGGTRPKQETGPSYWPLWREFLFQPR